MRYGTKNKTWDKNLISVETVTESSEQIITLKNMQYLQNVPPVKTFIEIHNFILFIYIKLQLNILNDYIETYSYIY